MTELIFSTTAQIHIQGPQVIKFVSLDNEQALFDVLGMSDPKIQIIDRRPSVRRKMKEILQTRKVEQLTELFNQPAHVTIIEPSEGQNEVIVQLSKTRAKNPRHLLWIAVGIKGEIPFFDYEKLQIQPFKKYSFALFCLYKRSIPESLPKN